MQRDLIILVPPLPVAEADAAFERWKTAYGIADKDPRLGLVVIDLMRSTSKKTLKQYRAYPRIFDDLDWEGAVPKAPAYYTDAVLLAEVLHEAGEQVWADRITQAVEGGSTATEILMALQHHLTELLATGPDLRPAAEAFATRLRDGIRGGLS